jgi:hypothetical protein
MTGNQDFAYSPINVPKPVAEDLWIVDGPVIRFGMPWPKMPFPTRMTIVRLPGRRLFVHSPTLLTAELKAEIARIGTPTWLVAPNRIHYWWIPDWHAEYPLADVFLAPRIRKQAGKRIAFDAQALDREEGYPWDQQIATVRVESSFMTEFDFFHRPSRSLILTDLIENFEPAKLGSLCLRWLTRLGGVQDPDGQMPRDMRMTFSKHKQQLRAAVAKMIEWNPQRVILAHGRWYERDGAKELQRAFRWLH